VTKPLLSTRTPTCASHIMVLFLHPHLFSNRTPSLLTPQCQNTQSLVTSTAMSVREVFLTYSCYITRPEANKIKKLVTTVLTEFPVWLLHGFQWFGQAINSSCSYNYLSTAEVALYSLWKFQSGPQAYSTIFLQFSLNLWCQN